MSRFSPLVYFGVPPLDSLLTEQPNPSSERIDSVSTSELLAIINREDRRVAEAVEQEIPRITRTVDAVVERFGEGGRLFYAGAGTSGRLGVLDAAECPPTFGVDSDRVQAVLAGGPQAVWASREGAEDDDAAAEVDLAARGFSSSDALVAVSASGRTPYALGAARFAKSLGAFSAGISCNPQSELAGLVDVAITPVVGPEVITGSTRMKAGTAQKLVFNMISSGVMVRMGYVLGNRMVNVQLKSEKLRQRAERIVAEVSGCSGERAREVIEASGGRVRMAVVMAKRGLSAAEAEAALTKAGDNLWRVIGKEAE